MIRKKPEMTFSHSKADSTGFQAGDLALVFAFAAVRCLWLYLVYTFGPDQAAQMNVAMNIMDGRGIVYGAIPDNGLGYVPFNWFPPGYSFFIIALFKLTGDMFVSDYLLKCLFSFLEGALVVSIARSFVASKSGRAIVVLLFAFYIGHMDRGMANDMIVAVAAMWLMYTLYRRVDTGVRFDARTLIVMALALLGMILAKYNSLPIVLAPLGLFLWLGVFHGKWILDRFEWASICVATLISVAGFVWCIKFIGTGHQVISDSSNSIGTGSYGGILFERLGHFFRIDPFWLHFGRRVDMYFKSLFDFLAGSSSSLKGAFHFWQISTLVIFASVLILISRRVAIKKDLVTVLGFFAAVQVSFLFLLAVVRGPEHPVRYGIDGSIWTYMEEARYYNHLTFAITLAVLIACWRNLRPLYWLLSAVFLYNTIRTMADGKSELAYLSRTFENLRNATVSEADEEAKRNRRAFYLWNYMLGNKDISWLTHSGKTETQAVPNTPRKPAEPGSVVPGNASDSVRH